MSFSFQSFNYSSNIYCSANENGNHNHGKKKPTHFRLPPIDPPTEGNDNSSNNNVIVFPNKSSAERNFSSLVSGQPKPVGIIGGVLLDSTLRFANKMVRLNFKDGENGPPFVLCSDPALSKEILSLGRSPFPFVSGKTETECINPRLVVESLRHNRMILEKSGVCCVVMPCHISHTWHDEIKEGCSVPFLNMGECVAKELKEANFRPLEAGRPVRIGVLATNETLVARFYQEKLENEGFEVVLPDKATMEHTVIPAVEALNSYDYEGAQNLFRIALQVLLVRAVNRVIIASDEFQEILPPNDSLWFKCIDPIDALARAAVKYAQSPGKNLQNRPL